MDPIKKPATESKLSRSFLTLMDSVESKVKQQKPSLVRVCQYMTSALAAFPEGKTSFANIIKAFNSAIKHLKAPAASTVAAPSYVEMGDGLKWATCNLGASKPEEEGDYYAWGETKPYYTNLNPLTWKEGRPYYGYECNTHFIFDDTGFKSIKYSLKDKKLVLEPADDAARATYGGKWRIPTEAEWTALTNENNYTWVKGQKNGVEGYTVTSKVKGYEGNSIFLPLTRHFIGATLMKKAFTPGYWSSTIQEKQNYADWDLSAQHFEFTTSSSPVSKSEGRYLGYPIRAVSD